MTRHSWPLALTFTLLTALAAGCGSESGGGGGADTVTSDGAGGTDGGAGASDAGPARPFVAHKIALAGVWESSFGGNETVSDTAWVFSYGTAKVAEFDNDKRWAIVQAAADDQYNPNKFSKVVWTKPTAEDKDGFTTTSVYVCTVDFGLDTADLAKASTKTADDSDPGKSGCGGKFAWTKLSSIETAGTWSTNFGSTEKVNGQAWGFGWLRAFENGKNVAYTQNPDDAEFSPGKFNKLVWTAPKDGAWHYCTVDFGLDSLEAAQKTSKSADDADLDGKGCGGFPWTKMQAAK